MKALSGTRVLKKGRPWAVCLRVLILEDHVMIRKNLLALRTHRTLSRPIGAVSTVAASRAGDGWRPPDLILLALSSPDGSGVDAY